MMLFFILLQIVLLLFMLLHDFVPLPPWNDVETLRVRDGTANRLLSSCFNGFCVFMPLVLSIQCYQATTPSPSMLMNIFYFYLILTLGTIASWWLPYFFGSSEKHKQRFSKFNNTHHFLPARGDHVIPNTLHVVLHLQVWICFIISCALLM